jgi:hypothetical protein
MKDFFLGLSFYTGVFLIIHGILGLLGFVVNPNPYFTTPYQIIELIVGLITVVSFISSVNKTEKLKDEIKLLKENNYSLENKIYELENNSNY